MFLWTRVCAVFCDVVMRTAELLTVARASMTKYPNALVTGPLVNGYWNWLKK